MRGTYQRKPDAMLRRDRCHVYCKVLLEVLVFLSCAILRKFNTIVFDLPLQAFEEEGFISPRV